MLPAQLGKGHANIQTRQGEIDEKKVRRNTVGGKLQYLGDRTGPDNYGTRALRSGELGKCVTE